MSEATVASIVVVSVIVAFYLIILRPQQQEQKRQQKDIKDLQVGDEVLTTSGFLATVKDIYIPETGPVQIVLEFGSGIEVHALSTAIAQRVAAGQTRHAGALAGHEEGRR
ncbi:MAG: preprotein translocase subunit YajC [Dehalococcoidia bacterium]